jgi:hypothetical protein
MKKFLTATFVIPVLLAFGSLAYAQTGGIANTFHNLTPGGPGTAKGALNEICIYCHTPHAGAAPAADDGTSGRAPLWNRQDSSATYTLYSSPTLDSTLVQPRSVSKACLSCHDGTMAFNALLNRSGSGRDGLGGGTAPAGSGNSLGNQPQSNALSLIASDAQQLSNDHPISMVYGTDAKSPGIGTNTLGENSHAAGFRPSTASGSFAYVSSTTAANGAPTFAPEFRLPLYGSNQTVECASCHDPHEARTRAAPDADGNNGGVYFLRVANTNSQLCRTCHLK